MNISYHEWFIKLVQMVNRHFKRIYLNFNVACYIRNGWLNVFKTFSSVKCYPKIQANVFLIVADVL